MKNLYIFLLLAIIIASCSVTNSTVERSDFSISQNQNLTDTIPFEVTAQNNIKFEVLLNGRDSVDLFFDTGSTDLVMLKKAIEDQTTLLQNESKDFVLQNYRPLSLASNLQIGPLTFDSLIIFPFPDGPDDMAGHFGWDLFKDKVVELNYDDNIMIVNSNTIPIPDGYAKMNIEFIKTLFFVRGSIIVNEKTYTNRYLFDTGFQRAIVLDKDLRADENFPTDLEVIKESKLTNSEGTVFLNQVVMADQFCFGDACVKNVPTQLFNTPNPARLDVHILGNELLKRFNTIFDFKNNFIYLKPNSLIGMPYSDAS